MHTAKISILAAMLSAGLSGVAAAQAAQTVDSAQRFLSLTLGDGTHSIWPGGDEEEFATRITQVSGTACVTTIRSYSSASGRSYVHTINWAAINELAFGGSTSLEVHGPIGGTSWGTLQINASGEDRERLMRAAQFLRSQCDTRRASTGF